MAQPVIHFYEFGPFRLTPADRLLLRDGQPVPLAPKLFDILVVLVERRGHLLSKDELMRAVWPDAFVEEGNLTRNVSTLRKALGEGENEQHYIETVPKHGYRFVAEVREFGNGDTELEVRQRVKASVVIEEETNGQIETEIEPAALQIRQSKRWTSGWQRRRVLTAGVLLIGLVVGVAFWWRASRTKPASPVSAVKSIAVLPFKPLTHNESDEYWGLGMADSLITKLSSLHTLVVRPTSAVLKYATLTQDPLAAGHEQKVDTVLDASLQRDGERLRVTVRLLSLGDGTALWTYQCDEVQCDSLFVMQDVISEQVAAALMPLLTGVERQNLRKHYTEDKEAFLAYSQGRYFLSQRTAEGFKLSIKYFKQAIEKDPKYALAYAGLADCYSLLVNYAWISPKDGFPKAKAAALKALALDDTLGEAHASLAKILHLYDWNWAEAEREFQRAIELKPGYATAHQWYGEYLISLRRFEEAKAELRQALELDPISLAINVAQGFPFYFERRYDEAIAAYQKALELNPNFSAGHQRLAEAYEQKGMNQEAFTEYLVYTSLGGSGPEWIKRVKDAYAASGFRGYWQVQGAEYKDSYIGKSRAAEVYARLGEKEKAFEWLQKAYLDRDHRLAQYLNVDPVLDGLRSDPRFGDLLRRVGFAP
ncbi:MAG: winged helix-turn-helix domain-containing protein [Acidobacteria bacterium]|nr:winged helix-turn-helix domain-containing protein [Acidobacteriota bacterium]